MSPCSVTDHIRTEGEFYELALLEAVKDAVGPAEGSGKFAIDVGAHIGNHSLFFAGVMGLRVIAFEPVRDTFLTLKRNTSGDTVAGQIGTQNIALMGPHDPEVTASVQITPNDSGDYGSFSSAREQTGKKTVRVRAVTLDSFYDFLEARPPAVLKIDVERSEADVIRGGLKVIKRHNPIIVTEVQSQAEFDEIYALLSSVGYEVSGVYNATPTVLWRHGSSASTDTLRSVDIARYAVGMAVKALDYGARVTELKFKHSGGQPEDPESKIEMETGKTDSAVMAKPNTTETKASGIDNPAKDASERDIESEIPNAKLPEADTPRANTFETQTPKPSKMVADTSVRPESVKAASTTTLIPNVKTVPDQTSEATPVVKASTTKLSSDVDANPQSKKPDSLASQTQLAKETTRKEKARTVDGGQTDSDKTVALKTAASTHTASTPHNTKTDTSKSSITPDKLALESSSEKPQSSSLTSLEVENIQTDASKTNKAQKKAREAMITGEPTQKSDAPNPETTKLSGSSAKTPSKPLIMETSASPKPVQPDGKTTPSKDRADATNSQKQAANTAVERVPDVQSIEKTYSQAKTPSSRDSD